MIGVHPSSTAATAAGDDVESSATSAIRGCCASRMPRCKRAFGSESGTSAAPARASTSLRVRDGIGETFAEPRREPLPGPGLYRAGVRRALVICLLACAPVSLGFSVRTGSGAHRTLRVPAQYATVQKAVDAARSGDLVLISPGTYREAVTVRTPRVVVRGTDRNRVILDGGYRRDDGFRVTAPGVAIENLTVHRYQRNGILFTGALGIDGAGGAKPGVLDGFRASYVTASNNALYGIYAFAAQNGQIDHGYVSGNADSGVYVGQCRRCNVITSDMLGELNAVGYENTNASGAVSVIRSTWRRNRVGIAINSQDTELLAPSRGVLVAGNLVERNDDPQTPEARGFGVGIVIAGSVETRVEHNLVRNNGKLGIVVTDLDHYAPSGNRVRANTVSGDQIADLAGYVSSRHPRAASGNCFAGNAAATSFPKSIERALPCPTARALPSASLRLPPAPVALDFTRVKAGPPQPSMANPTSAPALPAVVPPRPVDPASLRTPR